MPNPPRSRIGIHSTKRLAELTGLNDLLIEQIIPEASGENAVSNFSDDSDDEGSCCSDIVPKIHSQPPNLLPYKMNTGRNASFGRTLIFCEANALPTISLQSIHKGDLRKKMLSAERRQEIETIFHVYTKVDCATESPNDQWGTIRARLISSAVDSVFSHPRRAYADQTVSNAVYLFDVVFSRQAAAFWNDGEESRFRVTRMPVFASCGLALQEIVTLFAACLHVSCKLSHVRHLQSKRIAQDLNCGQLAIHLYEMLLLQETKSLILIPGPSNLLSAYLPPASTTPFQQRVFYISSLILIHGLRCWKLTYLPFCLNATTGSWDPDLLVNTAVDLAHRLLTLDSASVNLVARQMPSRKRDRDLNDTWLCSDESSISFFFRRQGAATKKKIAFDSLVTELNKAELVPQSLFHDSDQWTLACEYLEAAVNSKIFDSMDFCHDTF